MVEKTPGYVGENRCLPCTAVNLALVAVAALALARRSRVGALSVGLLGTALVWTRGYIVPYTPRFAPWLVSFLPVDPFHRESGPGSIGALDDADGEAVLAALAEAGVVRLGEDRVTLDPAFEEHWVAEMGALRSLSDRALADELAGDLDGVDGVEVLSVAGDVRFALGERGLPGTFVSRPVAIAELAAIRTLGRVAPTIEESTRAAATRPLRGFLERCPACECSLSERPVTGCCGGRDPRSLPEAEVVCPACDRRLFVVDA
ncbi:hypothetical protein [Natronorarus salvus]|uniref:hypothetical protein n=1 Tax=Natronorarus salvus TaxID=3117733 RepID=UPI002F26897A